MTAEAEDAVRSVDIKIRRVINGRGPLFSGLARDASLTGGRKLRARLFYAFSRSSDADSTTIAAAIEVLHLATLIHDDIIDRSPSRREQPAFYLKRDTSTGILYGDYLFSAGFLLITELKNPLIHREISLAISGVLRGELTEQCRRGDATLTKVEYLSIIRDKSGTLFGTACKLGALTRGLGQSSRKLAYVFGVHAGMAYQILNDCSDYCALDGTRARVNDFRQGVITLPLIYLLERCGRDERNRITKTLAAGAPADARDARRVVRLLEKHEVLPDCFRDVRSFLDRAAGTLPQKTRSEVNESFDAVAWIRRKVNRAEEKYRRHRRGLRRD